jgi:hypothetical protein
VLQDRACRQPASRPVVGTAVNRGPTSVRRSRRSVRGTSRERGARPEEPPPVVGPKQLRRSRTQPPTRPQAGMPNATRSQGLRHHLNNPSLERGSEQCLLSWTGAWEGRTDRMTVTSLDAVGRRRSRQSLPAAILSIYLGCIRRPMRKAGPYPRASLNPCGGRYEVASALSAYSIHVPGTPLSSCSPRSLRSRYSCPR